MNSITYDRIVAGIMIAFSLAILYIYFTGLVTYYLQPIFQYLSLVTSILSLVLGVSLLTFAKSEGPDNRHIHNVLKAESPYKPQLLPELGNIGEVNFANPTHESHNHHDHHRDLILQHPPKIETKLNLNDSCDSCCHDHESLEKPKEVILFAVLTIFFMVAFLISPHEYSLKVIENRRLTDVNNTQIIGLENSNHNYSLSERGFYNVEIPILLYAAINESLREKLNKDGVEVIGQFVRNLSSDKSDDPALVRFMMFCCSADARPIGISLKIQEEYDLKNMEWVRVTGTIEVERDRTSKTAVLIAKDIYPVPEPANPMIAYSSL